MDESLPNVAELEDQLAAQQSMIEQMRDTLLQREQTVSSNEKKVQDFAATLSRIRSSHRPNKKKDDGKNLMALDVTPEKGPSSKMTLLRKQMEENRAILEQRGKLINEHKQSVEGMVEMLSAQLTEKDLALEEVRRSRETQENLPSINPTSEESRELYAQVIARDNKIIELNNKIFELERSIMDYEESLREKESVLEARTRAVALVQEDLSHKHLTAVHQLEDAKKEVAELKSVLATQEEQLKAEKKSLLENLLSKEQKLAQLETIRFDLSTRNAELQHKIVALQTKSHEVLSQGLPQDKEKIEELESKIEEIETNAAAEIDSLKSKIEESAKLLTKAKVAYSKKIKNLEQKLQQTQGVQDLEQKVAELEEEKGNLQLILVDFEEIKASEMLLRQQVSELEAITSQQKSTLDFQSSSIDELEKTNASTYNELQQLRASEAELQTELEASKVMVQESECTAVRANMKTVELEERLEQAEKAYNELSAEVDSLVAQKVSMESSQELQDVVDATVREKNTLNLEVQNLRQELAAQEVVAKEASEALLHVQQTLSLKATEHEAEIESLQAQIMAKEQRVSQLEERLAALSEESQHSLAQLNQSLGEAQQAQEALARAETVVSQEENRIAHAEQKIETLEGQIVELQQALEQTRRCHEEESQARSHAQEEVRQLRAQLEESAVQLESASETMTTLENLRQEYEKLQKRYVEETTSLKSRLEQAEDEVLASATQAEQKNKDHQTAMESWNNEIKFLKDHITGLEESNNELYEQIENLGLEKESVQSELWSVKEELGNLKESSGQQQQEAIDLLKSEKDSLNNQIQTNLAQINELQLFISAQKTELENHQASVATLSKDLENQKAADGSNQQALDELRAKLQTLEDNLKSTCEEKENLVQINGSLEAQLLAYQNQQNSMEGMNAHIAAVTNELEQLRWTVGEKDQALQMIGQQVAGYENHCRELNSHIKQLDEALAQSNASKEQLQTNLSDSQALISQIQTDQQKKEVEIHSRLAELESINVSLQECLEHQKNSHESEVTNLKSQVESLMVQLTESQQITKSSIATDEISWGEDAWQEPEHRPLAVDNSNALLVAELQKQLKEAEETQAKLTEDLRASQVRCGKALKQLKTIKEQKKPASDLDKVMEEELQSQVMALQKELSETQAERTALATKTETLKDANIRLSDSKKQLDLEIERLKVERLALEQEAADWSQDDRVETLERQLQDMYLRCKELEEHIAGDEEAEAESMILQENLVKSRERCAELERLRQEDEEKLRHFESQLKEAVDLSESLKKSVPRVEDTVTAEQAIIVESARIIPPPSMTEMSTMTDEVAVTETSVNTDQLAEVPVPMPPAVATVQEATEQPKITPVSSSEMEKLEEALHLKEQERDALAALVAQLRGALEVKMQEVLTLRGSGSENMQSDLDSALYQLHQRDVRCDELTLELMALMEERDALQLRLSSALRVNAAHEVNVAQEVQKKEAGEQSENLQLKLHELHSVGHKRDVTLRGEQEARHTEQQAAFLPHRSPHFTPHQRVLQIEDSQPQQGSSGLLGWLWGY